MKLVVKLSLSQLGLVLLVVLFSILVSGRINTTEFPESEIEGIFIFLYIFFVQGACVSLIQALLAIGYSLFIYWIVLNHPRWRMIMILNAIVLIILFETIAMLVYFNTPWFSTSTILTFTRTIVVMGAIGIILPCFIKLYRRIRIRAEKQ